MHRIVRLLSPLKDVHEETKPKEKGYREEEYREEHYGEDYNQ